MRSAVHIVVDFPMQPSMVIGSGVIYKDNILSKKEIVTAHHVAEPIMGFPARACLILEPDECVELGAYRYSVEDDLAIYEADVPWNWTPILPARNIQIGEDAWVYGVPLQTPSLTKGIISSLDNDGYIQTDTRCVPGNSGGMAFDKNGKLIGIVSAIRMSDYGIIFDWCLVVPVDKISGL